MKRGFESWGLLASSIYFSGRENGKTNDGNAADADISTSVRVWLGSGPSTFFFGEEGVELEFICGG